MGISGSSTAKTTRACILRRLPGFLCSQKLGEQREGAGPGCDYGKEPPFRNTCNVLGILVHLFI